MRSIITLVLIGTLTACATTYQQQSFTGGFDETQLDTNVFRVSFRGNAFTAADRAEEMALLRSAELALQHGYSYFAIVDSRSQTAYGSFTTPKQSTTTGTVSSYGNTAYLKAQTNQTGGDTVTFAKPSSTNTIVCFNSKPDLNTMVYNAQFVFDSLAKKYGIAPARKAAS